MLNRDTIAQQFLKKSKWIDDWFKYEVCPKRVTLYLAVKLIDGVVRVPVVLKLNESKVLQKTGFEH